MFVLRCYDIDDFDIDIVPLASPSLLDNLYGLLFY